MIVFLFNVYLLILFLLVYFKIVTFNLFWKISPLLVLLLLTVGLFIPMGWGAPSGSVLVGRHSGGNLLQAQLPGDGEDLVGKHVTEPAAAICAANQQLDLSDVTSPGQFAEVQRAVAYQVALRFGHHRKGTALLDVTHPTFDDFGPGNINRQEEQVAFR